MSCSSAASSATPTRRYLEVYFHLCAARDHAASAREALDASHAAVNGKGARGAAAVVTAVETRPAANVGSVPSGSAT
jgi:hypothetical protein